MLKNAYKFHVHYVPIKRTPYILYIFFYFHELCTNFSDFWQTSAKGSS